MISLKFEKNISFFSSREYKIINTKHVFIKCNQKYQ